jgi:tRNA(fMet)-specific endonuclease VapC
MSYLLDTNHVVPLLADSGPVSRRIRAARAAGDSFAVATTVLGELFFGAYASIHRERNLARLDEFLADAAAIDFDRNAAREFGKLQAEQKAKGRPIPQSDAHMAAVARLHDLTLLTEDRHFALVDDLRVENWMC